MCAAPQSVKRAVLLVPSAIKNAPAVNILAMALPMAAYLMTRRQVWFERMMAPLIVKGGDADGDIMETAKCSVDNTRIKSVMPGNVPPHRIGRCAAPTLVMAAEKDVLFPAGLVLPRAERILPGCRTYRLSGRGHIHRLTEEEKRMIADFLTG